MRLRAIALTLCLVLCGVAGTADPLDPVRDWAEERRIGALSAVILQDGTPIKAQDAARQVDLASNSKAITALCVKALVDRGALRWDMPLAEALGRDAPEATLAEIVTHSGGIWPDSTQLAMRTWLEDPTPRHEAVTETVLDRGEQRGTRGAYAYNNENYALLGRVIERVGGRPYVDLCGEAVLRPAGVSGTLSPRFGAYAAFGGWRMSMGDYARLHWHYFGPDSEIGRDPLAHPHVRIEEGVYYGLGMIHTRRAAGWRVNHAGALRFFWGPHTGSYAVIFPDGRSAALGYDRAVTRGQDFRALDRAVQGAVGSR